ncbi:fumarylacetoacetate hydrolase family protein [Phycicoccus flavus]|uniref:fumarylacetoacetate hydrolase family protein n=1 Tax=Phycicoccus flavus TaxID=2502783 RepID=UPI000FEB88B1|nr:fumarylacetoacetate hydrolase family protein [Phycicoccus flavus]NHA66449.1 fumarylacetoacetate hydrolase family protein [Phycicoccus flavus]
MRLARRGDPGQEIPVVERPGGWADARGLTRDFDGPFFESGGLDRVRADLEDLPLLEIPPDTRWGAPVARPPAVVCIGMNYAAHAAESGAAPPERPVVFLKHPNTVVGPGDDVVLPPGSTRTDWEVELGVVVGRRCSSLSSPEEALTHVAGYCTVNDVSERELQLELSGGQWSKGKCCPTFTPTGPFLVTPDDVPADPRLRSWVNGEPRQDSATGDMVFSVGELLHDLSRYLTLEPGDLVLTGTPEGVALSGRFPYLRVGDVVEVEVEGLGRARQALVARAPASAVREEEAR